MSRKDLRAYLSLAALLATQTVSPASAETLPIKKISVDGSKQLVVEFGGAPGSFPAVPHVLDLPGPNHRVVLDFTDASLDKQSLPPAAELSTTVTQSLPFVKSVRYTNLENAPAPTARLVLDVPEDLKFKPRVVKLEEGSITISLGDDLPGVSTASAPAAAPEPVATASAVSTAEAAPAAEATTAPATTEMAAPAVSQADAPQLKPSMGENTSAAGLAPDTTASAPLPETSAPTPVAPAVEPTPAVAAQPVTPEPVASAPAPTGAPTPEPGPEALGSATEAAPSGTSAVADFGTTGDATDKKLAAVKRYNAAVQFHLQGKLSEAIAEYKAALESNNALAEAHSNLGLIYNQQHNYAQALAEFRKALAINPKDAITYNGIGAALRAEKDLMGAIKNWQTAVSLDPKLATAHYNLGTAYEINKEYDKALASYGSAVKNDYRLGEAYYRMGLIMERKRRPDDAAQQFQEALKVSSDSEYSEDARQRLAFLTQNKKGKVK